MSACPHCASENDETRVFCSNCGTRLPVPDPAGAAGSGAQAGPGSVVMKAGAGTAPPLPGVARKGPLKPARSSHGQERGWFGFLASAFLSTAAVAAVLACLIQMAREPDRIPQVIGIDTAAANETFATLRELTSSAKPSSWTVNSKAVNQFLETTIQMKPSGSAQSLLNAEFQRAFIRLNSGNFDLGIDQKFLGQHLYLILNILPESTESGLGATLTGGSIGRLPVHPSLFPVFLWFFEPTITGLSQPLELLKKVKSVTVTPEDATLKWPGTGTPAP